MLALLILTLVNLAAFDKSKRILSAECTLTLPNEAFFPYKLPLTTETLAAEIACNLLRKSLNYHEVAVAGVVERVDLNLDVVSHDQVNKVCGYLITAQVDVFLFDTLHHSKKSLIFLLVY